MFSSATGSADSEGHVDSIPTTPTDDKEGGQTMGAGEKLISECCTLLCSPYLIVDVSSRRNIDSSHGKVIITFNYNKKIPNICTPIFYERVFDLEHLILPKTSLRFCLRFDCEFGSTRPSITS